MMSQCYQVHNYKYSNILRYAANGCCQRVSALLLYQTRDPLIYTIHHLKSLPLFVPSRFGITSILDMIDQATLTGKTMRCGGEPNPVDTTGLCLLSLDGGGVRGLSTLYILKSIMDWLNG